MELIARIVLACFCCAIASNGYSQSASGKLEKCKSAVNGGKYELASISPSQKDSGDWFGNVLVKPKDVNKDFMIQLAKRLKSEYCMAEKFQVVIFDDSKYINQATWQDFLESKGKIVLMRGFYSYDRVTGKDILEFSTKRGNPTTEVQIDLSKLLL